MHFLAQALSSVFYLPLVVTYSGMSWTLRCYHWLASRDDHCRVGHTSHSGPLLCGEYTDTYQTPATYTGATVTPPDVCIPGTFLDGMWNASLLKCRRLIITYISHLLYESHEIRCSPCYRPVVCCGYCCMVHNTLHAHDTGRSPWSVKYK